MKTTLSAADLARLARTVVAVITRTHQRMLRHEVAYLSRGYSLSAQDFEEVVLGIEDGYFCGDVWEGAA